MSISYNQIPAGLRVPFFYAEVDNSMANLPSVNNRTILFGQRLAAGTVAAGSIGVVPNIAQVDQMFGAGSQLAEMLKSYRAGDPFTELWYGCLADANTATAASATLTITGSALDAGALSVYLYGKRYQVGVNKGDLAAAVATNVAAAVNADVNCLVSAAVSAGVVTFTAKNKGSLGNDLTLRVNQRGLVGGEQTPNGLVLTLGVFGGGAVDPDAATAMTILGDEPFEFIGYPYADAASLDALRVEMNDISGRWAYMQQLYGHAYTAKRGTLSALSTLGRTRNDQHITCFSVSAEKPMPVFLELAAALARTAVFINADPSRPTQTGELVGIASAAPNKDFLWNERQVLLSSGMATTVADSGGTVRIERAVTMYQKNAYGADDVSYLDSETMHQHAYVIRRLRGVITSKYGRHKLANDGTRFDAGQAIVTPSVVRGELLAEYKKLELEGHVENYEAFAANLIVERNANNPNRLDILFPPDMVNQLRMVGLLYQFRLQY